MINENVLLEAYQIQKLLKYGAPFIMMDKVIEYERGSHLIAIKAVSMGDPFLAGHFPTLPIMPGVLITEALAQSAALMLILEDLEWVPGQAISPIQNDQFGALGNIEMRFIQSVFPGNLLKLEVEIDWRKGGASAVKVEARVGDDLCAKGRLTMMSVSQDQLIS